jgi:hypothetical protein
MKIEIGESLAYTWLRHVCKCQIVQTNWKVSPTWDSLNRARAFEFMELCNNVFHGIFNLYIFKQNANYSQVLGQGECDALGIKKTETGFIYYGLDVAFHTNGLGYGNYVESAAKVIEKCVRTAMCLHNYMGTDAGEIVFISPKIQNGGINILNPAIEKLNQLFAENNYNFNTTIYYGDSFKNEIIQPSLNVIDDVNDTSELFLRSAQMLNLFGLIQNTEIAQNLGNDQPNDQRMRNRPATTKYLFEGNSYKMGRLALEIVKNYVGNHPETTYNELREVFPQTLIFNRKPIIRRITELSESELNGRRAYTNADDLISVADANDVCVSSQWSKEDMPIFLETIRNLGFDVQTEE